MLRQDLMKLAIADPKSKTLWQEYGGNRFCHRKFFIKREPQKRILTPRSCGER